jgi:Tol biopolymer transport system component
MNREALGVRIRSAVSLSVPVAIALLLLAAPAHAAFHGNNGKIAFVSSRDDPDPDGNGCLVYSYQCNWEIYTMNADGTGQTRLTNNPAADEAPAWSPDGTKIAFMSKRDPVSCSFSYGCPFQIFVMNADGSGVTRLTTTTTDDLRPAWSPDGKKIAFLRGRTDAGYYRLVTMNVDGSGATDVFAPSDADDVQITADSSVVWSPDGSTFAASFCQFCQTTPIDQLFLLNADGTQLRQIRDSNTFDRMPDWSPDETQIAFMEDVGTHAVMNRDGSGFHELYTSSCCFVGHTLRWSPDGSRLILDGEPGNSPDEEVYTAHTDGSQRVQLTNTVGRNTQPAWQPLPVGPGYSRPKGATPFQTYLTVAYKPCTSPNEQHGAPLAVMSCSPPQQASNFLTVGTLDANAQQAKAVGSLRFDVKQGNPATPANEADVKVAFAMKDVRNKSDLSDYAGELLPIVTWRMTDRWSGPIGWSGGTDPATAFDANIPVAGFVPCATNADATVGSTCNVTTTMNANVPGSVQENRRVNVEFGQVQVYDSGADGNPNTTDDNTLFLTQGIFVP